MEVKNPQQPSNVPMQPSDIPAAVPKRVRKMKGLVIVLVGICLVGAAVGVIFVVNNQQASSESPYRSLRGQKVTDEAGVTMSDREMYEANKLIKSGDLEQAKKVYDSRVNDAKDTEKKTMACTDAASSFLGFGTGPRQAKALEYALAYAKEAEQLQPTAGTAGLLVQVYSAMKDTKQQAYYQTKLDERLKELNDKTSIQR